MCFLVNEINHDLFHWQDVSEISNDNASDNLQKASAEQISQPPATRSIPKSCFACKIVKLNTFQLQMKSFCLKFCLTQMTKSNQHLFNENSLSQLTLFQDKDFQTNSNLLWVL